MIDLILVDPPAQLAVRFGKLAEAGSFLPSLGLCSLAAVARKESFSVKIIDANLAAYSLSELTKEIIKENPRWVGLSATTLTIDATGRVAAAIKKKAPETIIFVGGAHVTAIPQETLKKYPGIDIGIIGEGEETLRELLLALDKKKDIKRVKGLIIRDKRKLFFTGSRPFIQNLDDLPLPAWDLLEGFPEKYRPSANSFLQLPAAHLVTSRGCMGKCLFCDRSVFGRLPRMYSAERVLTMIEHLVRNYGVREIQFFDDNFPLFPKRLEAICQGLIAKNWDLTWSCQARCDLINPTILCLMKKAGCWQIGLGIESGSDKILQILKKGETKEKIRKAVETTARTGMEIKGFFILGNPGETRQTFEETMDFILSLPLTYVHTTYFTPYPGSEAYQVADRFGKFKHKNDWLKLGRGTIEAVFIPQGLTKKYLEEKASEIFSRFYFRPPIIYYYLKKAILLPHLWPAYIRGFFSVVSFARR